MAKEEELIERLHHHGRHPWLQSGDRPDRYWLLLFDDPDRGDMRWNGPDAETEALAAYALYSPTWNCTLMATVPYAAGRASVSPSREAAELGRLRALLERAGEVVKPFARLADQFRDPIAEVCEPHPDNPSRRIEPIATEAFSAARTLSTDIAEELKRG